VIAHKEAANPDRANADQGAADLITQPAYAAEGEFRYADNVGGVAPEAAGTQTCWGKVNVRLIAVVRGGVARGRGLVIYD
jgi:hypothetical protein